MTVSGCSALVIADPCYVLQDEVYDTDFLERDDHNGVIGDAVGLVHGTYYGDGGYDSESGMNYGVDAGSLGIYDTKYCKSKLDSDSVRVIEVDPNEKHFVELEYDAGNFYFSIDGKVVEEIYTAPEEEEDDEDYWSDDEEDDEEYEEEYESLNESIMTKVDSISDFKNYLRHNILVFAFTKKDGSVRVAVGTTNQRYLNLIGNPRQTVRSTYGIPYYDIKSQGWRLVALQKGFSQTFAIDQFIEIDDDYDADYIVSAGNDAVEYLDEEGLKSAYNDLLNGSQDDYESSERNYGSEWVNGTYELVFKGPRGREVFHNIESEYIPQYVSRMRAKGYNLIQKIPMSDIG